MDLSLRYEKLSACGDPLERLNGLINWRIFLPLIERAFKKERKSLAGRKPFNRLMMFKVLVLQQLYNLSDPQTEYQIRDRLSFIRFLNLGLNDPVPDEKTIWAFREVLVRSGMIEKLFTRFEIHLANHGYGASCGSIIDASIVPAPKQRNSREDNQTIKSGEIPEHMKSNQHRMSHKDVDARWTVKRGQSYFGYKSHINADVKYKLIRRYAVTAASTADIHCFKDLLHKDNDDAKLWADSAYHANSTEKLLTEEGYESRIIKGKQPHLPQTSALKRENSRRAKIRKRIEHVFGFMENSMGGKFIRCIGMARAQARIGLMNLVYNLCRYEQLHRIGVA